MSNAVGEVIQDGKRLGWFEYMGTADVLQGTSIWATEDEITANWRQGRYTDCVCETPRRVPVTLYSSYGGGFWWSGEACLTCRQITDGFAPEDSWGKCPLCGAYDTLNLTTATKHIRHGDGHPTHEPSGCPFERPDY